MKKILLTYILLLIFGCGKQEQNLSSDKSRFTPSSASVEKNSAFWNLEKFPLKVHISESFHTDEAQVIRHMGQTWTEGVKGKLNFLDSAYSSKIHRLASLNDYKDAEIGIYKLSEWPEELPANVLGLTQVTGYKRNIGSENEHIELEHGDIFLNYEVFDFSLDDSWGYSLHSLILHELGHLLGLEHDLSSAEETVMYPYLSRETKHFHPTARDLIALESKYELNSYAAKPAADYVEKNPKNRVVLQFYITTEGREQMLIIPHS